MRPSVADWTMLIVVILAVAFLAFAPKRVPISAEPLPRPSAPTVIKLLPTDPKD